MVRNPALKPRLGEAGKNGRTALALAAEHGDVEIVAAVLEAGADANQRDARQTPPIYLAATNGHTRVVEKLLQAGADPDSKNAIGDTALIEAADWGDPEMVRLLLDAGADPKMKAGNGQTPMSVDHGLHGREIKALLLEAVRKRLGGKPEKGQGLSFLRRRKGLEATIPRGVQDFRDFYYGSHPEWSVAMVRGQMEEVARLYVEMVKPKRWEKDVGKRKISSAWRYIYIFQLKDSAWTVILRSLGFLRADDMEGIANEARELSKQLKTRAYTYMAEDTSGAEGYEVFEDGHTLEKAENGELMIFESKLRAQPKFDENIFPDPVFADEGIYLPSCYPESDGYDIKLVFEGLQRGDVARVDFMVLQD